MMPSTRVIRALPPSRGHRGRNGSVWHPVGMSPFSPDALPVPIIQAPMAGGPSTPSLAAAVSAAGGLGFLAAGYKTADAVAAELGELRSLLPAGAPFGVNVFAPPGHGSGAGAVAGYAATLQADAERSGAAPGEPRWDDDRYAEKLELLAGAAVAVVSFTFGCPAAAEISRLKKSGASVWVTVTSASEARAAASAGADALIVQGIEAGGHRGGFTDEAPEDTGLLALLQLVRRAVGPATPLVATGGIATGEAIAAVLAAGAAAAQLGTAFMLCPEAATVPVHRAMIEQGTAGTALTRAFTGRTARGISNRFLREHSADAPSAYPEIHHLTAPLRAAARQREDADGLSMWAGQAYPLTEPLPAAEIVQQLAAAARQALAGALNRLDTTPAG